MSDYFVFDGKDSRDFGAYVFNSDTDSAPARVYSVEELPGRNGSLLVDAKRYEDKTHTVTCAILDDFATNMASLRSYLLSQVGYKRLEDSFHTDEFYLACFREEFVVQVDNVRKMGKVELQFSRKPQRFLKSGEAVTTLTKTGSITNPTLFDAKPLLRIYGKGTVGIGDNAIKITAYDGYTDIDCEIMEAYKGATSCNGMIQIQNIDFPVLHPGVNGIALGSGITKVEITPRWWRM